MAPPAGDVRVVGADEQQEVPVDMARWVDLARNVLLAEGVRGDTELSLLFIDEDAIAGLNQRYMDTDGPTDVLAFPIDDAPRAGRSADGDAPLAPGPLLLGDVVVCPLVAQRQAAEHAGTYDDELALLVVHGVLHVLGHDHAEADEAAAMQARERQLLERFHRP